MIIQKPQFDPEILKCGEAIMIYGVDALMMHLFDSSAITAIIKEVHPFQIDIVYVDGDVQEGVIKIDHVVDDKLTIHRFMAEGEEDDNNGMD